MNFKIDTADWGTYEVRIYKVDTETVIVSVEGEGKTADFAYNPTTDNIEETANFDLGSSFTMCAVYMAINDNKEIMNAIRKEYEA